MGTSLRRAGICICWIASFGSVDNLAVGAEHENGGFAELGEIGFHDRNVWCVNAILEIYIFWLRA